MQANNKQTDIVMTGRACVRGIRTARVAGREQRTGRNKRKLITRFSVTTRRRYVIL